MTNRRTSGIIKRGGHPAHQRPRQNRTTSFFQGSNLDGVEGSMFLLFGTGGEPGMIRIPISTVPGRSYTLSYFCGGTDTQRFSIGSGQGFQVTFKSSVLKHAGKKTIIDDLGQTKEVDMFSTIAARTHVFSTPGLSNWRIHEWLPASYPFVAEGDTSWIEFETSQTNGMASVGVLDQVLVTTEPFVKISVSDAGIKLNFAGRLQESADLMNWSAISPQPASPFIFQSGNQPRFFRVEK